MKSINLGQYVNKFLDLKNELMEHKLNENDASLLASRLLELPQGFPSSLYFQVKQSSEFRPYAFLGTGLTIKKIDLTKGSEDHFFKLSLSIKRGVSQLPLKLQRNQALLFLCLLVLKFKNFEEDAYGGFSGSLNSEAKRIGKIYGFDFWEFCSDDYDNLKRKLSVIDFNAAIERYNGKGRISVPPHHISFEETAKKFFEELSGGALSSFEREYGPAILTV